jgi:hypothetical protein
MICPGQVPLVVAGGGRDEFSNSCVAEPGIFDPGSLLRLGLHPR